MVFNSFQNLILLLLSGEKTGELTHEKISQYYDKKAWVDDIAVKNGKMLLACRKEGIMLFNLT